MSDKWTTEWPETEGWYWFYGWPWGGKIPPEPRLGIVEVVKISNGYSCVYQGSFIYKSRAVGFWHPLDAPCLPDYDRIKDLAR